MNPTAPGNCELNPFVNQKIIKEQNYEIRKTGNNPPAVRVAQLLSAVDQRLLE
jgi:hypothetical protein